LIVNLSHCLAQWNQGNNELNYVQALNVSFHSESFTPHFIIDSGRNGVSDMRSQC